MVDDLEACLASLDTYFRANGLKVNESKFELLPLGTRQNLRNIPSFTVQFRDKTLTTCSQAKNLGVTFDRYLSWEPHVTELSRRCVGVLSAISHLRHCLPSGTLTTIVTALVFSHIRYCVTVFGNGSAKNLEVVQKIMNFAARVISGRRKFEHISDVREGLGWLGSQHMVTHQTLTLLHKLLTAGEPESLVGKFCTNQEQPTRVRSTQDHLLSLPRIHGTATGKRQFVYRAAEQYNALPPAFKSMSVSQFKRSLKLHLASHPT